MKLAHLEMLDVIATSASLTEAANKLHKTQPALSQSLKKLEAELGFQLLDRTQYRLCLTEKGRHFQREASLLLQNHSHLKLLAKELAQGNEPKIKICYQPIFNAPEYQAVLADTFRRFPNTEFSLSNGKRFAALEQVNSGSADLGIGPWFDLFHATGDFESLPIGDISFGILSKPSMMPKEVSYEELSDYPCLAMLESDFSFDSERLAYAKGASLMKMDDIDMLRTFMLAGVGWALGSLTHCQQELANGVLQQVRVRDKQDEFHAKIHVFRQTSKHHGPVARALWQGFKALSEAYEQRI
ncbi:LysR family transcriptional regulator [Pseudoalteromonas fenneropenaei]|uniref:LysR family transcriptional regulator n=1 Tax=Pseudoalteromonas fenneropenaei TaxID=1737459 RepID=A0ABV7CME1_9GAMM